MIGCSRLLKHIQFTHDVEYETRSVGLSDIHPYAAETPSKKNDTSARLLDALFRSSPSAKKHHTPPKSTTSDGTDRIASTSAGAVTLKRYHRVQF